MRKLLAVLMFIGVLAQAQESKKTPAEAMMDFYIDQAKPVAEHERLADLAGSWKVNTKLWFDPAQEPMTASGTGTGKMILGGRFLLFEASVAGAVPTESLSLLGFDRRTNDYTMVGVDSMGTYSISAAGKYDKEKNAVVLDGSYAQPPSGNMQRYRFVWSKASANEHLLTLYFDLAGTHVRVAETRFTRK